jgi:hypothetical protein
VAQRHVDEDDLPHPARVGNEHLGSGAGRSARRAAPRAPVRDPPRQRAPARYARRVGPRPGAGHRALVHHRAERGEPGGTPGGRRCCHRSPAPGRRCPPG